MPYLYRTIVRELHILAIYSICETFLYVPHCLFRNTVKVKHTDLVCHGMHFSVNTSLIFKLCYSTIDHNETRLIPCDVSLR